MLEIHAFVPTSVSNDRNHTAIP